MNVTTACFGEKGHRQRWYSLVCVSSGCRQSDSAQRATSWLPQLPAQGLTWLAERRAVHPKPSFGLGGVQPRRSDVKTVDRCRDVAEHILNRLVSVDAKKNLAHLRVVIEERLGLRLEHLEPVRDRGLIVVCPPLGGWRGLEVAAPTRLGRPRGRERPEDRHHAIAQSSVRPPLGAGSSESRRARSHHSSPLRGAVPTTLRGPPRSARDRHV